MKRHDSRILLVRPDDVLLIGHAGDADLKALGRAAQSLKDTLGLRHVVIFSEDIDMDVLPETAPLLSRKAPRGHPKHD